MKKRQVQNLGTIPEDSVLPGYVMDPLRPGCFPRIVREEIPTATPEDVVLEKRKAVGTLIGSPEEI